MKTRTEIIPFALLLGVLIPLELVCAALAYETIGEITSRLYIIGVIGLNALVIALAFRYRVAATLCAVALVLLVIPYQVVLGERLLRVQAERRASWRMPTNSGGRVGRSRPICRTRRFTMPQSRPISRATSLTRRASNSPCFTGLAACLRHTGFLPWMAGDIIRIEQGLKSKEPAL